MSNASKYEIEISRNNYILTNEMKDGCIYLQVRPASSFVGVVYEKIYTFDSVTKEILYFQNFSKILDVFDYINSLCEANKFTAYLKEDVLSLVLLFQTTDKETILIDLPARPLSDNFLNKDLYKVLVQMSNQISFLTKKVQELEENNATKTELSESNKKIEKVALRVNKINTVSFNSTEDSNYFSRVKAVLSNDILIDQKEEMELLRNWICKYSGTNIKLSLLYKASIDSDSAAAFHEKCDDHSPTVTLIKTKEGQRFGGFTLETWNVGEEEVKNDPEAFLFSFDTKKKYMINEEGDSAIYCSNNYGPSFGKGFDICLPDNFMERSCCYSKFPYSYGKGSQKCEMTFRSINFNVSEVEVYQVEFIHFE